MSQKFPTCDEPGCYKKAEENCQRCLNFFLCERHMIICESCQEKGICCNDNNKRPIYCGFCFLNHTTCK